MSIPTFNETMYPLLDYIKDGKIYDVWSISDTIRDTYFRLNDEERKERVSNWKTRFHDRLTWGRSYLKKAGLVDDPARGLVRITNDGQKLLQSKITKIDIKLLRQYEWFETFANKDNNVDKLITNKEGVESISPTDLIDLWFNKISLSIREDLREKLKIINPYYFEKVILELLNRMGYGDFIETPKSWDGGIDWIINQDELGVDKIYIQCKRFNSNKVREPDIRNFIWAMSSEVSKWIFVTTSDFDNNAIEKARTAAHKIILINWERLVDLMIKFNIWVQNKTTYVVKEVDNDYFIDE